MSEIPTRVVLDANILFRAALRDTLLRAAGEGLFKVFWSKDILEELRRNLISPQRRWPLSEAQASRLITTLHKAFPSAGVSNYESLIPSMQNDPKDRHVVAAAVTVEAEATLTSNTKDFRDLPPSVKAICPDQFLVQLVDLAPDIMVHVLKMQVSALKRPPVTLSQLLTILGESAPTFEQKVRLMLRDES